MASAKEIQNRKVNARLYPIYKMISWDLLFYYSIIYLFLTQAKGFSASQVLLAEAAFTSMCLIIQIPIGILVEKIGKKRSLVFANVCMCLFTIVLIFLKTYTQLFVAYFLDSVGYVIKCVCETNILYDSLPKGKKRGSLYSTLDGLGASRILYGRCSNLINCRICICYKSIFTNCFVLNRKYYFYNIGI